MQKHSSFINNLHRSSYHIISLVLLVFLSTSIDKLYAQSRWKSLADKPQTLDLAQGFIEIETPGFRIKLVKSSQTMAAMVPKVTDGFDFTPADRLELRSKDGLYHLGDLNVRIKVNESEEWTNYSTAARRSPVEALSVSGNILAGADLANTLPENIPLKIERYWELIDRDLVLRFEIHNKTEQPVEIGSLGIPMIFDNILQGKSLDEAHVQNVFYDPYIGMQAGYLQVIRLHGHGPVLLVVPYGETSFEAYNPLIDDPTPRGITFEGFHEWMIHSKAHAENDWSEAVPWNKPTSVRLNPGESRSYGIKFLLTDSIKNIETKLIEAERPVAVGIPGYVVPKDVDAKLFLNYKNKVRSIQVEPEDALVMERSGTTENGWEAYKINGKQWGRARLTVIYEDGMQQTIHYKVIESEQKIVKAMGNFLATNQWYNNENDPFNRNPSFISYDYDQMSQVVEDSRAWIPGLSDEAGAGSWLAAVMKQLVQPNPVKLEKIRDFAQNTLWGGIQYSEGPRQYGVRKSMFYYEPDKMPEGTYDEDINYKTWAGWSQQQAESTVRSYNYPHVAAAHWVFYRLARNYEGLITNQSWQWYLENAFQTAMAMVEQAPDHAQFGQMEGTIFLIILRDLQNEGLVEMAGNLEDTMKKRADLWRSLHYPYGSEMPWDSTGQEEVYMWSKYFGYDEKAEVTLNAILAYMPTLPHWGYNGSARRYWDFLYGGKLRRIERQLHHYGSGLNAIPVLREFRDTPDDFYLLKVGYGGLMGSIANITEDGFGPAAFHSYPSTLKIDGYSGDFGSGFFGYAVNTSAYIIHHQEFGWLSFGGNLKETDNIIIVELTTAAKSRIFIAPAKLWLTLDAGQFNSVSYNPATGEVGLYLNPVNKYTPYAYLRLEQPTVTERGKYMISSTLNKERGAYIIPLKKGIEQIKLYLTK